MGTEQYLVGEAGDKAFDPHSMHKLIIWQIREWSSECISAKYLNLIVWHHTDVMP